MKRAAAFATATSIASGDHSMKRTLLVVTMTLLVALTASARAQPDTRKMVELPVPMRQHMLGNMRDHLQAISAIEDALATGAFDRAGQIAEQRLGLSSLAAHGAEHMAPYMPKEMQALGTGMHRAASRFALVVQETSADGDLKKAIGSLAAVTQQCVACHAAYRVH